jgi:hypothetical protein
VAVTPATVLRDHLAAARGAGATFEAAFPEALTLAVENADRGERAEWADVLTGMAEAWQDAYDRRPVARGGMTALIDASRAPAPDRPCRQCGGQIPLGRPARSKYCCQECNAEAGHERERQARMQSVAA